MRALVAATTATVKLIEQLMVEYGEHVKFQVIKMNFVKYGEYVKHKVIKYKSIEYRSVKFQVIKNNFKTNVAINVSNVMII